MTCDAVIPVTYPAWRKGRPLHFFTQYVAWDGGPVRSPLQSIQLDIIQCKFFRKLPRQGRFARAGCADNCDALIRKIWRVHSSPEQDWQSNLLFRTLSWAFGCK